MNNLRKNIPGIALCLAIAIPAWLLGNRFPLLGGPVLGILAGMLFAAVFPPLLSPNRGTLGMQYTSKNILQYSVILLGFDMELLRILEVGRQALFVMLFTLSASFLTAYAVEKFLKIPGKSATLIGVGTSICGGSAIAAVAPVIDAKEEDVAHAISTIFLFNIAAVFLFPALGHLLGVSDTGFGMWAGTAINDTSSVVAAGASWSSAAGNNTALAFATIVKLTRTLLIVPIAVVLAIYTSRKENRDKKKGTFRFAKVFPWFVLGFLLAAVANTFLPIPQTVSHFLVGAGKFMIVMAMTAIGLRTSLKKLLTQGLRPVLLGLSCWFAVSTVSLLVQSLSALW